MTDNTPITAPRLRSEIAVRYAPPEWLLESELTLGNRRLDVVAFNLWGARSHRIVGFEIKVSRGDWLRELNAFQKSEEWMNVADAFYVVTPPKLIQAGELPDGWGHLELCGSRMMTRRHATVREGRSTIPREIAARIMGRLAGREASEERNARWQAEAQLKSDAEKRARESIAREREQELHELEELRTNYREILKALGVRPNEWRAQEAALRAAGVFAKAQEQGLGPFCNRMHSLADELAHHVTHLRDAVNLLRESQPQENVA